MTTHPMSLDMSQDSPTMTMLTKAQYAQHHGITEKTVQRDLNAGRLPGAVRDERGYWRIPADATRVENPGTITRLASGGLMPVTADQAVDRMPGYVPLDAAAYVLGIPETAIRRERQHFALEPFGPHGALVMPRHRIKEILG